MINTKTMFDIASMSPTDARHNLEVLAWLFAHQEELKERTESSDSNVVSMNDIEARGGFNGWRQTGDQDYVSVSSQRFLPVKITVFSDSEDATAHPQLYPQVSLDIGENTVYPDDEGDTSLISRTYGIHPGESAWKINNNPWGTR